MSVPEWDVTKCIQCNQCAYVCPHATIRPFAFSAEEAAAAPAALKVKPMTGQGCENYQFGMRVSPLDCMGCGVCVDVCPAPGKEMCIRDRDTVGKKAKKGEEHHAIEQRIRTERR